MILYMQLSLEACGEIVWDTGHSSKYCLSTSWPSLGWEFVGTVRIRNTLVLMEFMLHGWGNPNYWSRYSPCLLIRVLPAFA
jgi:hypothetical protein